MKKYLLFATAILGFCIQAACTDQEQYMGDPVPEGTTHTLSISKSEFAFSNSSASEQSFQLTTTSSSWRIMRAEDNDGWSASSQTFGVAGTFDLKLRVDENKGDERATIFTVKASGCADLTFSVSQAAVVIIPDNIAPDKTGMRELTSTQFIPQMGLGWNLGNTLEAIGGEVAWGNPQTSKAIIDMVKAAGFTTIRIPVSWAQNFIPNTTTIAPAWIERVKTVVDYCIENDMYVLLNEHWDNGWLNDATAATQADQNAKLAAIWKQVAIAFRHYDDRLLFAGTNEVTAEKPTAESYAAQNSFNQTFINTVRATGGRNTYRHLAVQFFNTDIDHAIYFTMPTDQTPDRLIAEVHYYTPYPFCLMEEDASWGKRETTWGKFYTGEDSFYKESHFDAQIKKLTDFSATNGLPFIIGEYGAILHRTKAEADGNFEVHKQSRAYFSWYVNKVCKANNIGTMYWDAGGEIPGGVVPNNSMSIFNRKGVSVCDKGLLNGIVDGFMGVEFTYKEN